MDDLFKDLVFLGGTPISSTNDNSFMFGVYVKSNRMSKDKQLNHSSESTKFYTMEQLEYLLKPNRILRNGAVRVFIKTYSFTHQSRLGIVNA